MLLSIAGGPDLGLFEVSAAANLIETAPPEDATIIFGPVIGHATWHAYRHIVPPEPTRPRLISYAVFCLKKKTPP